MIPFLGGDHSVTEPNVRACAATLGPAGLAYFGTHTGAGVFGVDAPTGR